MERVLAGFQWQSCLVFLNDVIVYGKSFEKALHRISSVLRRLRTAGPKLSSRKCTLFQRSVPHLGHVISAEGISIDPAKVKTVREWSIRKAASEVICLIGLCSLYRKFIKGFSKIARPLDRLTEEYSVGRVFNWTRECNQAFFEITQAFTNTPVLTYPEEDVEYLLVSDTSDLGIGAI